ncbi:S-layer homology domain-containing protein [Thermosulfurimonas dismutans]|uniref:Adenylate cyclase n=1 Tax=Thermosulfurimonas dismutans TaxID=999894 RepID=A0A179D5D2_9BACT|nr:S-layer homology domain-containing protein [Thermosulfurimonas dismutans]OAQ20929.1 Adenylate cyclase [Thermosulfurimonas dismutans]
MREKSIKRGVFRSILLFALIIWVYGCAPKSQPSVSLEDTPPHHYLQGMKLLEKGDLSAAEAKFERALALDPGYARAYAGKALVAAMRAEKEKDLDHKRVEVERALQFFKKALKKAEDPSDKFSIYVTGIRVYTHSRPKGWLKEAEKYYHKALDEDKVVEKDLIYYQTRSAVHYFMGVAYLKAYEFRKAEQSFSLVLSSSPGKWHDKADILYRKVQKIVRASAQYTLTNVAKKIAVKDQVGRGDVAALLVDELHLDKFFSGRIPIPGSEPKPDFVPADVMNHMFKEEILTVIKWRVRGLEPVYDETTKAYLFKPDEPLTRKELAFILEDLLIKITGDKSLATKYFGQDTSPYPDVSPTAPWFNAVMNVVTRGLMETNLSGAFRPNDYVDGAELLLAILRLRNVMNVY